MLDERHYALTYELAFWEPEWERDNAKAMVVELEARIDERHPLGTVNRVCGSRSLSIARITRCLSLSGKGRRDAPWTPLLPRA